MRSHLLLPALVLGAAMLLSLLATGAQEPVVPARLVEPATKSPPPRDLARLTPQQRAVYLSAHRGMDWLRRTNRQDGRFVYGFLPDLRVPLEGDSYVAQAGAALALARAARYFGDEQAVAICRQTLLTLLLETTADPKDAQVRFTAAPPHLVNRLASHGQLVLAVHEVPSPGKDLLDQADQLCNYLRKQQQSDGSLLVVEAGDDAKSAGKEAPVQAAGLALHGLVRSHRVRPAAWKLEAAKKAHAYYAACWQRQRTVSQATSHTPALVEAFLQTKDKEYAELVFAMNDWLCTLQYDRQDGARAHWAGGFQPWLDGKAVPVAPDVRCAEAAESLAEACRAARAAGDLPRLRRYSQALDNACQFLLTLQYTEARTQHFVEAYRPALLGAFFASHQDGRLRIDYTQHALCALVQSLEHATE